MQAKTILAYPYIERNHRTGVVGRGRQSPESITDLLLLFMVVAGVAVLSATLSIVASVGWLLPPLVVSVGLLAYLVDLAIAECTRRPVWGCCYV